MSTWYQTVRFKRETTCPTCGGLVARRASHWTVTNCRLHLLEANLDGDHRADYLVRCRQCEHAFEVRSPEDVTQYKQQRGTDLPTGVVIRLDGNDPPVWPTWSNPPQQVEPLLTEQIANSGLGEHEVQAATKFVESVKSGTATEEQANRIHALLSKAGPAGAVVLDQIKDLAARYLAYLSKP